MTFRHVPLYVVVAVGMLAAACASATGGRRAACDLAASDSAFALGRPVFRDCGVDRAARFLSTGGAKPDFRPATPTRSACYSADLAFVVDSTGRPETSTAQVVRANDQAFGQAVLATIGSWRYEPAIRDGISVRQIVTSHHAASTAVVAVPQGSPPPSGRPRNAPRC